MSEYTPASVSDLTRKVLEMVATSRMVAEIKHGTNTHYYPEWISLMAEELGEAAKEANAIHFRTTRITGKPPGQRRSRLLHRMKHELLQVAQLAVATIEQIEKELGNG